MHVTSYYALHGGSSYHGDYCGVFSIYAGATASFTSWNLGAARWVFGTAL